MSQISSRQVVNIKCKESHSLAMRYIENKQEIYSEGVRILILILHCKLFLQYISKHFIYSDRIVLMAFMLLTIKERKKTCQKNHVKVCLVRKLKFLENNRSQSDQSKFKISVSSNILKMYLLIRYNCIEKITLRCNHNQHCNLYVYLLHTL